MVSPCLGHMRLAYTISSLPIGYDDYWALFEQFVLIVFASASDGETPLISPFAMEAASPIRE